MMLSRISTERIILVTVLKLLLVDGRKVNSPPPLNCRVFVSVASALTYCLIVVSLVEWMVKGLRISLLREKMGFVFCLLELVNEILVDDSSTDLFVACFMIQGEI